MIFSRKHNIIYIASPKTGTTSIHRFLEGALDDATRWSVERKDGTRVKVRGHATANEIKKILGAEYADFHTIAFVRDPWSKLVSGYFFLKKGGKKSIGVTTKKVSVQSLANSLKYLTAKLLPFKLWCLIYPYKSNREYLTDQNGDVIVDHIGRFEHLEQDFFDILERIGLDAGQQGLSKLNRSCHKTYEAYFTSRWFKKVVGRKLKADIEFCATIAKSYPSGQAVD